MSEIAHTSGSPLAFDFTLAEPTGYHKAPQHPFHAGHVDKTLARYSDVIELCIPRQAYRDNAKSFVQFDMKNQSNIANMYHQLLQLFGFIAQKPMASARDKELGIPPVVVLYGAVPKQHEKPVRVYGEEEDDNMQPGSNEDDDDVKTRCDEEDIVAMRLRVHVQSSIWSIGAIVDDLLYDNAIAPKKQLRNGRLPTFTSRIFEYKSMTRASYLELCVAYTGRKSLLDDTRALSLDLWDARCPINPVNVFTIQYSCEIAGRLGALESVSREYFYIRPALDNEQPLSLLVPDVSAFADNQMQVTTADDMDGNDSIADSQHDDDGAMADLAEGGRKKKKKQKTGGRAERIIRIVRYPVGYEFPRNGFDVYRIQADSISPLKLAERMFPHMRKRLLDTSAEQDLYEQLTGTLRDAGVYATSVNTSAGVHEANDFEHLRARMDARHANAAQYKHRPAVYAEQMDYWRNTGFREWQSIYNEDGDVADSIKAICAWDKEYLRHHNNFCMPFPMQHKNLSTMGNILAQFAATLDSVALVHKLHVEIISGYIGDLHVFAPVNFHTHVLLTGDNSTGKSFILDMQMRFLIRNTFKEVAYASAKADASGGRERDMRPEFQPEVSPGVLGIAEGPAAKGSSGNRASSNANTVQEALQKMKLTSGRMPYSVLVTGPDGVRKTVEEIGYCNIKFNGACNFFNHEIPAAMRSRFYLSEIQSGSTRVDSKGPIETISRADVVKPALEALMLRMQCTQSLVSKVLTLIGCGVIPDVHMDVAITVLLNVMKRGRAKGLRNTNDLRSLERVLFHARIVCIVRVLHFLFHGEKNEFAGRKWQPIWILEVRTMLVCSADDVQAALGLLEKQFEDPVTENVLASLKAMFPRTGRTGAGAAGASANAGQMVLRNGQLVSASSVVASASAAAAASSSDHNNGYNGFTSLVPPGQEPAKKTFTSDLYSIVSYTQPSWVNSTYSGASATILARELHETMNPKPPLESVVSCIKHLRDQMVSAGDPTQPALVVPILDFGYNQRGLAWTELLRLGEGDILANTFAEVMSYPGATKQTFLYPKSHKSHPLIFKTMCNDPQPSNAPLIMVDTGYYDAVVVAMTNNMLSQVDEESIAVAATVRPKLDFKTLFSTTQDIVIDCDADDFAVVRFMQQQCLSYNVIQNGRPISARKQTEACLATYESLDHMYVYPLCFLNMLSGTDVQARLRQRASSTDVMRQFYEKVQADEVKERRRLEQKKRKHRNNEGAAAAASSSSAVMIRSMSDAAAGGGNLYGVESLRLSRPSVPRRSVDPLDVFCDTDMDQLINAHPEGVQSPHRLSQIAEENDEGDHGSAAAAAAAASSLFDDDDDDMDLDEAAAFERLMVEDQEEKEQQQQQQQQTGECKSICDDAESVSVC